MESSMDMDVNDIQDTNSEEEPAVKASASENPPTEANTASTEERPSRDEHEIQAEDVKTEAPADETLPPDSGATDPTSKARRRSARLKRRKEWEDEMRREAESKPPAASKSSPRSRRTKPAVKTVEATETGLHEEQAEGRSPRKKRRFFDIDQKTLDKLWHNAG